MTGTGGGSTESSDLFSYGGSGTVTIDLPLPAADDGSGSTTPSTVALSGPLTENGMRSSAFDATWSETLSGDEWQLASGNGTSTNSSNSHSTVFATGGHDIDIPGGTISGTLTLNTFNPMPQARPVRAAVDLACGIGLNDENLFTALGGALDLLGKAPGVRDDRKQNRSTARTIGDTCEQR
ncbi:MAG: hypothetical protein R3C59_03575 [Planctomycetaceae bacterium]